MVDVLGEFITHCLADFVIALAIKVICRGKASKIGYRFEVPDKDV